MGRNSAALCLFLACCMFFCLLTPSQAGAGADGAGQAYNWYEIFVASYSDSDGDGTGDLQGLIGKLDVIREMGFTGIWLMPVMPSPSYHKYDVTDYFGIDPRYGSLEDMRLLVQEVHQRGMQIIIDLVLNHTSTQHPWFVSALSALREGRLQDPHIQYYNFQQEPIKGHVKVFGQPWYYEEQFAGGNMPDLNLSNPAVREEIKNILAFWLVDIGVDGFRLDAVTSFYTGDDDQNIAFLRFLKDSSQALAPGSFLVGECWAGLPTIARYYQSGIDSFFLFPASQAEGFVAASLRARRPADAFAKHLQRVYAQIPDGILSPFLCNHDTGRSVGLVGGRQAPQRVKFAHALLSLVGGYAFTYYGDEIGMVGAGVDPNKRLAMYWADDQMAAQPPGVTSIEYPFPSFQEQAQDPASILNYIKRLNAIRLALPALALGSTEFVDVTDDTLVLRRSHQGQQVTIAVNFSAKEERSLSLPGSHALLYALDTGDQASALQSVPGQSQLRLAPYGILYLGPGEGQP